MDTKTPTNTLIAEKVRLARIQRGLSQSQLAEQIGVTKGLICKYEKGARMLSRASLERIASVTEIPIAWFYEDGAEVPAHPRITQELSTRERWLVLMFARIERGAEIPPEERVMMDKLMRQALLQAPVDLRALTGAPTTEEARSQMLKSFYGKENEYLQVLFPFGVPQAACL